jgi:hypothetical protein
MTHRNQHVVPRPEGWAVRGEHNTRDTSHHDTQAAAIDAARDIARNQSSVLHLWVAGLSGRRAGWRFERCEIGKAPQVRGFPSVLIGIVRGVRAEL